MLGYKGWQGLWQQPALHFQPRIQTFMQDLDRPKWVAVVTGILAIAVSVGYLILVQLIDYRGSFVPAPVDLGVVGLAWIKMACLGWLSLA